MDAVEQKILELLQKNLGVVPKLSDELSLLGVDSVGMAELTFDLEKQFRIHVDDAVLDIITVADLVGYVRSRVGA